MASPTLPTLQQLDRLNRSSPDFQDQLGTVLSGKEYKRCVLNLQGDNLIWLVNYLDEACRCVVSPYSPLKPSQVLDGIDPSSAAFRKCLRELGSICGNKGILPRSYRFSSDLNIDPDPLAGGGYGVVYKGTVNGSIVCVKRVRVYAQEDPRKAKKVCGRHRSSPSSPLMKIAGLLPRGCNVETPDTPKPHTILGCHYHSPPAHFGLDVWRGSAKLHQTQP